MTDSSYLWNSIPIGRENAVTYPQLQSMWNCSNRKVRYILHELSYEDNGDGYVLIRSSRNKGFYRTNNVAEIELYKKECENRGRHTFAPLKKINRVLGTNEQQINIYDFIL